MSDWSTGLLVGDQAFGVLSTFGPGSPAADGVMNEGATGTATAVWPSANLALYMPVLVYRVVTVTAMAWLNGATLSGNIDAGIYDSEGSRLAHIGSTAQAGTSTVQVVSLTSTTLQPDLYYFAMAMDNTTGLIARANVGALMLASCGMAQQATAFPLPATATFAQMTNTQFPLLVGQIASAL